MSIKRSKDDIIFDTFNYIFLTLVLIVVLYPLYFVVISSISDAVAVNSGEVLFKPVRITFEGYRRIFKDKTIWTGYKNTIIYAVTGTFVNVILTLVTAYPLSRKDFSGRKIFMIFLMITMYFNGGIIPTYLIVKNLGLYNKWPVMILIGLISVYNVIITKSFLQGTIPEELYEAAMIDGCSHIQFFIKIILPLSKAIISVLVLYYGVGHWNEFMTALIYLKDEKLYPLQLILRSILIQNQAKEEMVLDGSTAAEMQNMAEAIKYGIIIVSSLPVLILYPFLQRYFVQGVMIGSVKG